jgi:hypothetical protein
METKKISVSGGFHNVGTRVFRVRNLRFGKRQMANVRKHVCPLTNCMCGMSGVVFKNEKTGQLYDFGYDGQLYPKS